MKLLSVNDSTSVTNRRRPTKEVFVKEYLQRINYSGELMVSHESLRNLQKAHLFSVPFENLDIHNKIPIKLDLDLLYEKIIINHRGGFCYELNGLFNELLRQIGFKSRMVSARVLNSETGQFGEEFDHMAIIVDLDNKEYLVDVGFGEFARYPLLIQLDVVQSDPRGQFLIKYWNNDSLIVLKTTNGKEVPEYLFTREERRLSEYAEMCDYHQTSPYSHFTQNKLISRPTEKGRITISGNTVKISEEGKMVKEITFEDGEFERYYKKCFNNKEGIK